MTSVSLFWKSYFQDLRWLQYSLRSVRKHWKDPYTKEYIVSVDEDCHEDLQRYDFLGEFNWVKWRYVKPWPDKYTHQMVVKSYADEFTSADSVMILDSDLILNSDCTTKDFMSEGKKFLEHPFTFSEFSALGLYAWNFESDLYAFEPASSKIKDLAHQWHSWSQFEEAEPELERMFPG
jgi:hypothetical protein